MEDTDALLQSVPRIAQDEMYGADERALNEFLVQHPMLNLDATSSKTLQIVATLFDQCATTVPTLPTIPKSHDDQMLRPSNKQIGERDCACGDRCMVRFLATWRHGVNTNLAFTCTEFLLPDERATFLSGNGLPARRKKCLVCTRYLTSYLYYKARTDPNFKLEQAGIDTQSFANSVAAPCAGTNPPDMKALSLAQLEIPESESSVLTEDSYHADAMLFVDEEYMTRQVSRTAPMSAFQWRPIVKFCSRHYTFEMTADGPRVIQTGIGANDSTGTGLLFQEAPVAEAVAPPELRRQ